MNSQKIKILLKQLYFSNKIITRIYSYFYNDFNPYVYNYFYS